MPIQRKNLFLTWGIRISLVPVILVLLALGLIAIVLFAICGVCGRFLAALGGLAALLALFDKCYQEAAVSAIVAFLLSPYGVPQVLFVCVQNAGRSQLAAALVNQMADGKVVARSAGSRPAPDVHPHVRSLLTEIVPLSRLSPAALRLSVRVTLAAEFGPALANVMT